MSLNGCLIALGIVIGLAAAIFAIDRLGLWLEYKRWIYWRKFKPKESMRSAIGAFQEFVQPEIRYVEEEKRQRGSEIDQRDPSKR